MRSLLLILWVASLAACRKGKKDHPSDPLLADSGKWIEKTQRLDTLYFNTTFPEGLDDHKTVELKARPYMDPAVSTVYPRIYSALYSYYLEPGYMRMRNFFSASTAYPKFDFSWGPGHNSFTIKKFYGRQSLPDRIEFVRLK